MALDNSQSHEIDLDRTDRLPILEGVSIDDDVADDSVRLDQAAAAGPAPVNSPVTSAPASDFARPGLDLPSLAESVRSVEERIARQNADYEALNRLYEKARDAQLAAGTRADTLAAELVGLQSTLAVEQHRTREMNRALTEAGTALEAERSRSEEALRQAERHQGEAQTLRDALAARDATIAQVLHSLGERDAQLSALQREHAHVVPALEARSQAGVRLEAELEELRKRAASLERELETSRDSTASLTQKLERGETELAAGRRELGAARLLATSYLEMLRSRDWRSGFNQNLFRDWDEKMEASRSGQGALEAECERLKRSVAQSTATIAEHEATIATLRSAALADAAALEQRTAEIKEQHRTRAELMMRIDGLEKERAALQSELQARSQELAGARASSAGEALRAREQQTAAEARAVELSSQVEQLRAEAQTHEEEMTVLMAHLNEARRPIQSIQGDIKRLNDELAQKSLNIEQLNEENRTLRANLERTRGALEERELLIRRLERSASNNANVLGRLQTSIERLGSPSAGPVSAGAGEFLAELIRVEGEARIPHPVGRRMRIGRATGCELQIDSQSVSRHHALLLKGNRELIIEDLNSTNGVLVNGRKVTRQVLSDGDLLTIGETQFQCRLNPNVRAAEPPAGTSIAASHGTAAAGSAPVAGSPPDGHAPVEPDPAVADGPPAGDSTPAG